LVKITLSANNCAILKGNLESNIHADEKYLCLSPCMLEATGDDTKDSFCDRNANNLIYIHN
jgi:hypothetical protein